MAQYEINDLVMVKDRGKIYEAKIINAQSFNEVWHYFVHFQGWNKKWDRWTDESEISKKTENVGRNGQRDGSEEEIVTTGTKRSRDHRKSVPEEKRRKQLEEENLEEDVDEVSMMKLQIPLTLKKHLLDEWELISKKPHRLVKLPRQPTVATIIETYLTDRMTESDQDEKVRDLFECLISFFDRALPLVLLYRQERDQYELFSQQTGFLPSTTYGAEHLLRLFVKLPQLFMNIETNQTDLRFMKQKITEFLKHLQKQENVFLSLGDYQNLTNVAAEEPEVSESNATSQPTAEIKLVSLVEANV